MKPPKPSWSEIFVQDDPQLKALQNQNNLSVSDTYFLLQERLENIVSLFHFSSQRRWGLQGDSQEIRALAYNFCQWLFEQPTWKNLQERPQSSSFSLNLSLGREWIRYCLQSSFSNKHSHQNAQNMTPEFSTSLEELSDSVMSNFSSLTQQLPERIRLSYQLYLDGLVPEEIAFVCEIPLKEVNKNIAQSKASLQDPDKWRSAS